jgi:hypothetical protein
METSEVETKIPQTILSNLEKVDLLHPPISIYFLHKKIHIQALDFVASTSVAPKDWYFSFRP